MCKLHRISNRYKICLFFFILCFVLSNIFKLDTKNFSNFFKELSKVEKKKRIIRERQKEKGEREKVESLLFFLLLN